MDVPALYVELKNYWADVDKLTFIVALLACFVAWRTWRTQHTHNRLSVMPLPRIILSNWDKYISIELVNNGSGPLRVGSLRFIGPDGRSLLNGSSIVSAQEIEFATELDGSSLSPNSRFTILKVQPETANIAAKLEQAAAELVPFKIVVEYTDVYDTKFPRLEEDLAWFAK